MPEHEHAHGSDLPEIDPAKLLKGAAKLKADLMPLDVPLDDCMGELLAAVRKERFSGYIWDEPTWHN